jgi:4-hydroxybutyrate dehydrogenase/sulfolactaldehyde 3-reductase
MKRAGFIGLGTMGAPMALNLAKADIQLAVHDVNPAAARLFTGLPNCVVAPTPADAARDAELLFLMLPDSDVVESTLFGRDGASETLAPNALVIEMSTGSPSRFGPMRERLARRGIRMMDAPMGRTPQHAAEGDLLVMVGAEPEVLEEVRPLLECFGKDIVHVGPPGHGIRLKVINNYMAMVGMVLTAETLMLARKAGLDRDVTVRVLQNTVAGRGQINVNFPRKVLAGDITPDFTMALGLKDLSLALDLAKSEGAPLFLGGASRELFSLARSWGRMQQDCTAMLLLLEDLAGCGESQT